MTRSARRARRPPFSCARLVPANAGALAGSSLYYVVPLHSIGLEVKVVSRYRSPVSSRRVEGWRSGFPLLLQHWPTRRACYGKHDENDSADQEQDSEDKGSGNRPHQRRELSSEVSTDGEGT